MKKLEKFNYKLSTKHKSNSEDGSFMALFLALCYLAVYDSYIARRRLTRQSPSHHDGQMSTAVAHVRAFSRAAAVPATAARASSRATRLPVRAAASTMSAPMKSGEAAALPYTIAPPAHPTYSIADAIKLALEEDIADIGDISSLST